jgi:hypothetical protein
MCPDQIQPYLLFVTLCCLFTSPPKQQTNEQTKTKQKPLAPVKKFEICIIS